MQDLYAAQYEATMQHMLKIGMVKHSVGLDEWHRLMTIPMDPARVKYVKPLQRIIDKVPVLYHGTHYRDATALEGVEVFNEPWEAEWWSLVGEANRLCALCNQYTIPDMPSAEDIKANIEQHREQKKRAASNANGMSSEFVQSLRALYDAAGADFAEVRELPDLMDRWRRLQTSTVESGARFSDACSRRDASLLANPAIWSDFGGLSAAEPSETFWKAVDGVNSLCDIAHFLPSNLLAAVETEAQRFHKDHGNADVTSMSPDQMQDLFRLGESLLSKMTPEDMSHLTENMDKLMPAITNNLEGNAGMATVLSSMPQALFRPRDI